MGMNSDQYPNRSVEDLIRIHAAWVENSSARKIRGDLLRVVAKALNEVLRDATAVGTPLGPAPRINPEFCFEPSVPVYPIMSFAWKPASTD